MKRHIAAAIAALVIGLGLSSIGNAEEPKTDYPKIDAETFQYCLARGRLAKQIADEVIAGTPLSKIAIQYKEPPHTISEQENRDLWLDVLKEEIAAAAILFPDGTPKRSDRIGNKIAETCAFNPLKSQTERRTDAGSGLKYAVYDEEAGEKRMNALRSCAIRSRNVVMVWVAMKQGISKEKFWEMFPLDPKRPADQVALAHALVDLAYSWTGDVRELEDKVYWDCKADLHLPPLDPDAPFFTDRP